MALPGCTGTRSTELRLRTAAASSSWDSLSRAIITNATSATATGLTVSKITPRKMVLVGCVLAIVAEFNAHTSFLAEMAEIPYYN